MSTVLKFEQPELPITGVGPRLVAAREALGVTRAQVSDRTKIPERMLALIEAGDFAALPAKTYATGFTRTYARALGLDADALVAEVRREIGDERVAEQRGGAAFEPGDPARVPSRKFAWLSALAALVVLLAGAVLWKSFYAPAVTLPPIVADEAVTDGQTLPLPGAAGLTPTFVPTDNPAATVSPAGAAIDLPQPPRATPPAQRRTAADRVSGAGPAPAQPAAAAIPSADPNGAFAPSAAPPSTVSE